MSRLIYFALAATHLLWAASLVFDPLQYVGKPIIPPLFAIIHIAAGLLLLSRYRVYGGWVTVAILSYYWAFVKPREPIAEPQSVGILLISTILIIPHLQIVFKKRIPADEQLLAVRLGLAYPFFEWGLDALRNPHHFETYLGGNAITQPIIVTWNPSSVVLLLGIFEIALAIFLTSGLLMRAACLTSLGALIVFSIVAAYPLALPQDITLVAAALYLAREGGGVYSLDNAFSAHVSEPVVGV